MVAHQDITQIRLIFAVCVIQLPWAARGMYVTFPVVTGDWSEGDVVDMRETELS